MKTLLILTIGFCLLLTSFPAMADQAADEAAIRKLVEQVYTALNNHDVKAFIALYDENREDWSGNSKGRATFEKNVSRTFERSKDIHWKQLEEIGIVFVTPEVAIFKDRHETSGRFDTDGKSLPPVKRLWAAVCAKKNDKWLIAAQFFRKIEE